MRDRANSRSSDFFCVIENTRDENDIDEDAGFTDDPTRTNAVLLTLLWGNTVVTTRTVRQTTSTPLDAFGLAFEDAPAFLVTIDRERAIVHTPSGEPIPAGSRMRVRVSQAKSRLVILAEPICEKRRTISDFWPDSRSASLAIAMLLVFPVLSSIMSMRSQEPQNDYEAEWDRVQMIREALEETHAHDDARDELLEKMATQDDAPGVGQETSGNKGTRHSAEEGSAGDPGQSNANSLVREAMRTHAPTRAQEIENAKTFGMVTLIEQGDDAKHTTSAFSTIDQDATRGSLRGASFDDSFGVGSYGLSGVGEGGGGKGEGIGLANIGGLGLGTNDDHAKGGAGTTSGSCDDGCMGRLGGRHVTHAPTIRCDDGCMMQANGRLPPEAIQRVVRQNFGGFRACYETGLESNPSLQGRVAVKFVIDREGAVAVAEAGPDTTMPSARVTDCVIATMKRVSFPKPEGGIVTVTYPLMFEHA